MSDKYLALLKEIDGIESKSNFYEDNYLSTIRYLLAEIKKRDEKIHNMENERGDELMKYKQRFQPIVDSNVNILGFEVLTSPVPENFTIDLERRIIENSLNFFVKNGYDKDFYLFLNLDNFSILNDYADLDFVVFEISERKLIHSARKEVESCMFIHPGINMAIDDFPNYNAVDNLAKLKDNLRYIKFDMDLIKLKQKQIFKGFVNMIDKYLTDIYKLNGNLYRIKYIAEGVETEKELDFLTMQQDECKCPLLFQGFYIDKLSPLKLPEIEISNNSSKIYNLRR